MVMMMGHDTVITFISFSGTDSGTAGPGKVFGSSPSAHSEGMQVGLRAVGGPAGGKQLSTRVQSVQTNELQLCRGTHRQIRRRRI